MPSILITGANRGLGFEFARQYGADGWRVIATCRHPIAAAALQELVARAGVVRIIPLDVTNLESVRQAATQIEEPIDIVINSAGIGGKRDQKTGNVDYESWREVLNVNTMGPLRVTEAFVDHLARSERKLVVTITSGMGSITDNTSGGLDPLSQFESGGEHGDANRMPLILHLVASPLLLSIRVGSKLIWAVRMPL